PASLDRTPMIVLTAAFDSGITATYTHQVFDQGALLAPITKWSATLGDRGAGAMIDRALALATSGVPGPVHVNVPVRVAAAALDAPPAALSRRAPMGLVAGPDLDALGGWLARRERPPDPPAPGIRRQGAHAELAALARRAGAAVITTYKAKGVMAEDDPLVIGGAGLSPVADRALFKALGAADLILCLGYDPVEMRDSWIQP